MVLIFIDLYCYLSYTSRKYNHATITIKSILISILMVGLQLIFSKFFPGFPNFFQVFKSAHFWVYY